LNVRCATPARRGEDELDEGDTLSCDECGANLRRQPVPLNRGVEDDFADDDEEEPEEEEEEDPWKEGRCY
jgi:hypothetical protein